MADKSQEIEKLFVKLEELIFQLEQLFNRLEQHNREILEKYAEVGKPH